VRWLPLLLPRLRRARYASTLGLDIRFAVTNLIEISAEHVYDVLCCACGQAENAFPIRSAHSGERHPEIPYAYAPAPMPTSAQPLADE
jgi:hypothetical protein